MHRGIRASSAEGTGREALGTWEDGEASKQQSSKAAKQRGSEASGNGTGQEALGTAARDQGKGLRLAPFAAGSDRISRLAFDSYRSRRLVAGRQGIEAGSRPQASISLAALRAVEVDILILFCLPLKPHRAFNPFTPPLLHPHSTRINARRAANHKAAH